MQVKTKWFGTIEVGEDKIITFEKGLIGFDEFKKYTIVYNSEKNDSKSIMWLQSLDEESLAIPIMDPAIIMPDYDPIVEDELLASLGDIKTAEIIVFVTLTVPSDISKMTSNFKAPIIVNVDNLKACQIVADNEDYVIKYPIYDIIKKNIKEGGE